MEDEPPNLHLHDLANPEALIPGASTWPWIAAAVALAMLVAAGVIVYRSKRRAAAADPAALRRAAWLEAGNALESVNAPSARAAAVQCSLILRRYLSTALGDPALFETHEEFIGRRDSLKLLTSDARQTCSQGFGWFATLKYAPEPPAEEPAGVIGEARRLLDALHHGFQAT
jgi:uncharacterized protein (TIGR04145 family)